MRVCFRSPLFAVLGAAVLFNLSESRAASAQTDTGTFFGIGAGLARGTMSVSDDSDSSTGLLLSAAFGTSRGGHRRWMLELDAQLFKVPSPILEERFRAVSLMLRRSIGSKFFFAPGVGLEYRTWSGAERVEASDLGPAIGLGAGTSLQLSQGIALVPELAWRYSLVELEGNVSASSLSLRLNLMRMTF